MGNVNIGAERLFTSAPTMDTERASPFRTSRNWTPTSISIFNHLISVDIPTGNLIISVDDLCYPYYKFTLGVFRKYDLQEHYMQLTYLREYPNVDPKPHIFSNWQFGYEADVDEVWHNSFSELHVTSGVGANGRFSIAPQDFKRKFTNQSILKNLLHTYSIPQRTLSELQWEFTRNDFLLRTQRGAFHILTGNHRDETLVDSISTHLWLFNPISGSGFTISSDYFYNIRNGLIRDLGYPLLVTKLTDCLGHSVHIKPTVDIPPFDKYTLSDDSGREIVIELEEEVTYPDSFNPEGIVRRLIASRVIDRTKPDFNIIEYKYNDERVLIEVVYPCSIPDSNRHIRYHYDDLEYPGVLTSIEDCYGNKICFEYVEDPKDNDERLNPRLKIKRIICPEGIVFEYNYDNSNSRASVTVSKNDEVDRRLEYYYIQDTLDTRQRYVTLTEIEITRGYMNDGTGNIVPQSDMIRFRKEYSTDGRFNVIRTFDPLDRSTQTKYNDFNQAIQSWDFEGHWVKFTYDIPDNPSLNNPRCYDLLLIEQEEVLRPTDVASELRESTEVKTKFVYHKYDSHSSSDVLDHNSQSTHRISTAEDEREKIWAYIYDDDPNNGIDNNYPLSPTLTESPMNIQTSAKYNNRGERISVTDAKGYNHTFRFNDQGNLKWYHDPNQEKIEVEYYPCGNWLHKFTDRLGKTFEYIRGLDGRIDRIVDPIPDVIDYEYYQNGRLHKIIHHRPKVPTDPLDETSPSLISPYDNLETEFQYSPLGKMISLRNPKQQRLLFKYDEAGRMYEWHHDIPFPQTTRFLYDAAGQLIQLIDRKDGSTTYTYYNIGFIKSVQYPNWIVGDNEILGKKVEYREYNYRGHVLSVADSEFNQSMEFVYDRANNLIMRRDVNGFELEFNYDHDGRLWQVSDSGGIYYHKIEFDDLGRPTTISDSDALDRSLEWQYEYEKVIGTKTKVLNLFNFKIPLLNLVSEFDYNENNHLKFLKHIWNDADPTTILEQTLTYRDDGLIEDITGHDANSFRYDGLKQIIYESLDNLTSDYDKVGNRLYRTDTTVHTPVENVLNDLNQLKEVNGVAGVLTYDNNGNIKTASLQDAPTNFFFDGMNNLRQVETSLYKILYTYDFAGKLVKRQLTNLETDEVSELQFHYHMIKPIVVKENDILVMLLTWGTSGELLRIRRNHPVGGGTCPNTLIPLFNALGNIIRLVNCEQQSLVEISYDPWGNITKLKGLSNLSRYWGYKAGFLDPASNLILFGARWYSPTTGRWMSEDPVDHSDSEKYRDSHNLYAYVLNNPITYSDPQGLQTGTSKYVIGLGIELSKSKFGKALLSSGDPGHAIVFAEEIGVGRRILSFGPEQTLGLRNVDRFYRGEMGGRPDWPIKAKDTYYVYTWEVSEEQYKQAQQIIMDIQSNPGKYTFKRQCASVSAGVVRELGINIPEGVGPVTVYGIPGGAETANPLHLKEALDDAGYIPTVVEGDYF